MKTVKIPELEELATKQTQGKYTEEVDAIILAYYYRIPAWAIAKYLNDKYKTSFTHTQIQKRASKLGLRKE
jgi:hypothetical protein